MPDFCTCGARLPEDARFCHKCGKPQYDYPGIVEESVEPTPPPLPEAVQPAGADINFHNGAAVRIGFLAALTAVLLVLFPLPFPSLRLLLAFSTAGFLAVFVYTRRTGQILSVRGGARLGWITGIFSFALCSILFAATMVTISSQGGVAKYFRSQFPPNDARAETLAQALSDPAAVVGFVIFCFIVLFVILTALPTIGGALGAKVFDRE